MPAFIDTSQLTDVDIDILTEIALMLRTRDIHDTLNAVMDLAYSVAIGLQGADYVTVAAGGVVLYEF